ncbi:MAG TPA: hypothetical protein PLV58_11310, partial [Campylobacterales bacterium]|nr:hypothetical protein [Campylobacterales bacterium]
MLKNNRVFINRVAVASCAGSTLEDTFEAILNGKSGVKISCDYSTTEAAVGLLDNNIISFKTLQKKVWKHPKYRNASELSNFQLISLIIVFLYFTCKQARDKAQDKHLV